MATIAAGGVYLAHELKGFGGNVNYTTSGQNSPIKTTGSTSANVSGGTTGNFGGDYTATPTVVEQPAPVIVTQPEPVVVNPVVVQ